MKKLILIHGALGSEKEFESALALLKGKFDVLTYTFPGHSLRSDEKCEFTIDAFTDDLETFMQENGPAYIFGFSMGGYVAINLARRCSNKILGIVTLGTKFDWNEESSQRETKSLDAEFLRSKVPPFYEYLEKLHGDNLTTLLSKTTDLMLDLGRTAPLSPFSLSTCSTKCIITRGGKDKMVSQAESESIANGLKHGRFREIPFLPHPLFLIKSKHLATFIESSINALDYKSVATSLGKVLYNNIEVPESTNDRVILFLHEALGSIAQWQSFPQELCEALNINGVVVELPGYGFTDEPLNTRSHRYLHEYALELIPELIEKILPNKKILLVGHSDGGSEGLLLAAKFPNHFLGVITMAAHIRNEEETKAGILPAIEAYNEGKLNGLQIFHGTQTDAVFQGWSQTWLSEGFSTWDITEDIQGIQIPGLVIQGKNDQYGTVQQVIDICECFENRVASLMIPDCGHAPHIENTKEVISAIKAWSISLSI
jgi:pimeloyl-ACP methyl ester carboxylesterase